MEHTTIPSDSLPESTPEHRYHQSNPGNSESAFPFPLNISVRVKGRHVHLTPSVIEALFGDLYKLHRTGDGQGGHYPTMETVTLIGPGGRIRLVPVMGPPRRLNQIEISRSDARTLGIHAPVRETDDWIGTPGLTVSGPRSPVTLGTGVICALRHVRVGTTEARNLGLRDRQRLDVITVQCFRFRDVMVRIDPTFTAPEFVVDEDEAAEAVLSTGDRVTLTR